MKSDEDNVFLLEKANFDALFNIYLRPLRSKNARRIFEVLFEEKEVGALTTLDIQAKLEKRGIELSKKEINGWLHSLNAAGLAVKGEDRGKPTTLEYDDKYTFDLWRPTDLGVKIARRLPSILGTKLSFLEADAKKSLEGISKMERKMKTRVLRHLDEFYMLARILQKLLEAGGELNTATLRKRVRLADVELDAFLSSYSNPSRGVILISRKERKPSFKTRLLSVLGLSSDTDSAYTLTEEGRRLAKALWSEEAVGH